MPSCRARQGAGIVSRPIVSFALARLLFLKPDPKDPSVTDPFERSWLGGGVVDFGCWV